MARGERERPGPPLPAPYRNPWSGLAEALRAVAADRRLALQRLWRRNRDGELPLPAFWPRDLAPLFWPLVLSAVLGLLLGVGGWLLQTAGDSKPAVAGDVTATEPLTATEPHQNLPGPGVAPSEGSPIGDGLSLRPASAETTGASPAGNEERSSPRGDSAASTDPVATSELRLDPLLELLSQGEDAGLLLAARPDPAASRLSLTLAAAAEALPQAELLEQAQRWQERAREAGYERLELRDSQGSLRGRGALVGSGMILLPPIPGS